MNENHGSDDAVVLVVESDILERLVIAEFLRDCGYRVIEAGTARDARTVLGAGIAVDIVLADVRLAGESNGFALASELRQTHPGIDVILSSGVDGVAGKSAELCEQGPGRDDPLKKRYVPHVVADRIKVLMERRRAARSASAAPADQLGEEKDG